MKAIILAAGYGTRLKPLTLNTPKCLIKIKDKPLLQYWLEKFEKEGISEVLINSHHLHNKLKNFINDYQSKRKNVKIKIVYENELLGTAGTVWNNKEFIGLNNCFIINGDILSNIDLTSFYNFHVNIKSPLTLSYIIKDNPIDCGILEIDNHSKIIRFEEKPKIPFSNLAYSGIQVINSQLFKLLPFDEIKHINYLNLCFGKDVWPMLHGKMTAYKIDCPLIDIGSMKSYKLANNN